MSHEDNNMFERVVRLEEKTDSIIDQDRKQDEKIDKLSSDLVDGLRNQEDLLREMVSGIKEQQQEMRVAYERMSSFTKGVLWIGGLGSGIAIFFIRYWDKIKSII